MFTPGTSHRRDTPTPSVSPFHPLALARAARTILARWPRAARRSHAAAARRSHCLHAIHTARSASSSDASVSESVSHFSTRLACKVVIGVVERLVAVHALVGHSVPHGAPRRRLDLPVNGVTDQLRSAADLS